MYQYAIDNTLHGRFMYAFGIDRSYFAEHFSPVLFLWVAVYAVIPSVQTLLVLQALVVTLAGAALFCLARAEKLSRAESGLVTVAFWVAPLLWRGYVFDVHQELMAPLFVFAALACAVTRRWMLFYPCLLLLFCVKEDLPLTGLAIALILFVSRQRVHGAVTLALSCAWVAGVTTFAGGGLLEARYGQLGHTPLEVVGALLSQPGHTLRLLLGRPVLGLVGSLGLGALLNPVGLVAALPQLLLNRASSYEAQSSLSLYYGLSAWTVLMAGVPAVLKRVRDRFGPRAALAVGLTLFMPATRETGPRAIAWPSAADLEAARALERIDTHEAVVAQTTAVPHLSVSASVSLWRGAAETPATWLVLMPGKLPWPADDANVQRAVHLALDSGAFGAVFANDSLIVLKRGAAPDFNARALERADRLSAAP